MKHKVEVDPKKLRHLRILEGFVWEGKTFQIDPESQTFIAGKALSVLKNKVAGTPLNTITWRTYDNEFYNFTSEEFLEFSSAVESHIENILQNSWYSIDNKE